MPAYESGRVSGRRSRRNSTGQIPLRPCIALLALLSVASFATGCASYQTREVNRLRKEVQEAREKAGTLDPTVRILVVFPPDEPPNHALAALDQPETLYLATHRFVLVIVAHEDVTIRYRQITKRYSLAPRLYSGVPFGYWRGGRDHLADYFTGGHFLLNEAVIVADGELHPIAIEKPKRPLQKGYPTLIRKYSKFSRSEYEAWLKSEQQDEVNSE